MNYLEKFVLVEWTSRQGTTFKGRLAAILPSYPLGGPIAVVVRSGDNQFVSIQINKLKLTFLGDNEEEQTTKPDFTKQSWFSINLHQAQSVRELQKLLNILIPNAHIAEDGIYGPVTHRRTLAAVQTKLAISIKE